MLAIYATVLVVCLFSIAVGEAILRVCGYAAWTSLAPAVGLSALVVLACAVVWLPGHRVTAGVLLALAAVAAGVGLRRQWTIPGLASVSVAIVTAGAVSIPFFVNRHTGVFGVSVDDDFAAHLVWANSLYSASPGVDIFPSYPFGPHTLAAALSGLLGCSVEPTFTGLLLAAPILTALTVQSILREMTTATRIIGGLLVALPYLVAAHLGEGAFKELMMITILLGFVLTIRRLKIDVDWRPLRAVPLGLLLAAILLIYGRAGAVWPLGAASVWVVAEMIAVRCRFSRGLMRKTLMFTAVLLLCALIASLSELGRLLQFGGGVPGGNVPNYVSSAEALGVWFTAEFRASPTDVFQTGLLVGLALALVVYAVVWWMRRRDFTILAATLVALIVYVAVHQHEGPYLTSKALVIMAAPTMLLLLVPLADAWSNGPRIDLGRIVVGLAGLCFAAAALWSSGLALRGARVESTEHTTELASFRPIIRGAPTLDLILDDFAFWELRGARLSSPTPYGTDSVVPFSIRKPISLGANVDVDTVVPSSLNKFRYIVTTSSQFASEMPADWVHVASTTNFDLWKRTGWTGSRGILQEADAPGAILNCTTPEGRALSRSPGVAGVWDTAPVGPSLSWQAGAAPAPANSEGLVPTATGGVLTQTLTLPAGRWEISLAYQSPAHVYMIAGNLRAILPPNLNLFGPFWRVGDVTSTGRPLGVTLHMQSMRLGTIQGVAIGGLAAVRLPRRVSLVPLKHACGRYVDWYQQ